jgi:hypothetical protein
MASFRSACRSDEQIPEQPHRIGPPARQKNGFARCRGWRVSGRQEVVISGIELAAKIKKRQFQMSKLGGLLATMPEIWQAALAT